MELNAYESFTISDISIKSIQNEGLDIINSEKLSIPYCFSENEIKSYHLSINPKNLGLIKYEFLITGQKNELLGYNRYLYNLLKINEPYYQSKTFELMVFPPKPEININASLELLDRGNISFEIVNIGEGVAKNIIIQPNIPNNIFTIHNIDPILILKPSPAVIRRNFIFNIKTNVNFKLSFDIRYTDIDGNEFLFENQIIFNFSEKHLQERKNNPKSILLTFKPNKNNNSILFEEVINKLNSNFSNTTFDLNKFYNSKAKLILIQIINYKKKVENLYWKKMINFKKELDFQEDFYNFLNEEGRFPDQTFRETQKGAGKIDLIIYNVPIEIKFIKKNVISQSNLNSYLGQLKEYCVSIDSKIGYLILFSNYSKDYMPNSAKINDFEFKEIKDNPVLHKVSKIANIFLVIVIINVNNKFSPSKLKLTE